MSDGIDHIDVEAELEAARNFPGPAAARDALAVYAVAMADHLGMDFDRLKQVRSAAEAATLTGDADIDAIFGYLAGLGALGELPESADTDPVAIAYAAVAPVIQPLGT